jgi:transposase
VSHRNARTTFHGRMLIVKRFGEGWAKCHIAAAMGISRKCVHTWIARYQSEGDVGLHDRSSRPHTMPGKTPAAVEDLIVELRTLRRCGPDGIGAELGVSARTVSRVLRRHQVPYLRDCDPMTGELIRASKATALRYERARPGELVHMDVKKLGRIPDGGGWRAHGHTDVPESVSKATDSTMCIQPLTTTPGWRIRRSCPTRKASPARASSAAPRPTSAPGASTTSSE